MAALAEQVARPRRRGDGFAGSVPARRRGARRSRSCRPPRRRRGARSSRRTPRPSCGCKVLEGLEDARGDRAASRALVDAALADPNVARARGRARRARPASRTPARFAAAPRGGRRDPYASPDPDVAIAAIGGAEKTPDEPEARAVVEAAYRHPSTLVSRLARRSLVEDIPRRSGGTSRGGRTTRARASRTTRRLAAGGATGPGPRGSRRRGASSRIRLAGDEAPLTVMNFVALAQKGYFDGAPHPPRRARASSSRTAIRPAPAAAGRATRSATSSTRSRTATGTVGMALSGPDTGGSQWFVTQAPQPHLDGGYTVFGQIVAGMDVVNRIEQDDRIVPRHGPSAEGAVDVPARARRPVSRASSWRARRSSSGFSATTSGASCCCSGSAPAIFFAGRALQRRRAGDRRRDPVDARAAGALRHAPRGLRGPRARGYDRPSSSSPPRSRASTR